MITNTIDRSNISLWIFLFGALLLFSGCIEKENSVSAAGDNEELVTENIIQEEEEILTEEVNDNEVIESSLELVSDNERLPNHLVFNNLLNKNVSSNGKVNYKALLKNKGELKNYLDYLGEFRTIKEWKSSEQLAFWINLYNAATIHMILENYPINSITKLENGKPWDKVWINANGKTYSLNHIENSIIRPQFKDPRIHFVLNCAAKSCPPLLNKAFTSESVYSLMEKRTREFINSSAYDISVNQVEISRIFEWYAEDFGVVQTFLNKYIETQLSESTEIKYKEYDWSLNE